MIICYLTLFPLLSFFLTGPVNNIQVVRKTIVGNANKAQSSWKRNVSSLPPPLEKYERKGDDTVDGIVIVDPPLSSDVPVYSSYRSADFINEQVKELEVCASSVSIFICFSCIFTILYLLSATRLCSNGD